MMFLSDLLLKCFQSFFWSFFVVTGFFFDEYTSVFLRELLIEMTDSSGRGIISFVLSRAFS